MADISISCPSCGNQITVSEFVDADSLVCVKCKAKVPVPKRQPPPPASAGLKLAPLATLPPAPIAPEPGKKDKKEAKGRADRGVVVHTAPGSAADGFQKLLPSAKRSTRRRRGGKMMALVLPWVLFVILGLALAWARYWPNALPPRYFEMLVTGGVWALVALHCIVVIDAFGDEVFQGMLCVLVPGYTVYHLFVNSDKYFLRSIAAAFLLAFGWDAALAGTKRWQQVYAAVNAWIEDKDTFDKKAQQK
jgi:uncharacterized membrane protein YidH (DUF202 family)